MRLILAVDTGGNGISNHCVRETQFFANLESD